MSELKWMVAQLATTIAAGYVQADTGRRGQYDGRPSPDEVARYSVRVAEAIIGTVQLGPEDLDELRARKAAREALARPHVVEGKGHAYPVLTQEMSNP